MFQQLQLLLKDSVPVDYNLDPIFVVWAIISVNYDNTICSYVVLLILCVLKVFYDDDQKAKSPDFGCAAIKVNRSKEMYSPK